MSDRLSRIEARLGGIDQVLADLHRRIDALEARELRSPGVLHPELPFTSGLTPSPLPGAGRSDPASLVSLVGRTFVVLGGAYLLRAVSESGWLPGRSGVVLGLAYAVVWLGAADRAGLARPMSGFFHGLAAVAISFPLLWEASAHFRLLSPATSAAALLFITGLALAVAWHRHLHSLAGVAVMGSIATTAGLVAATGEPVPFAAALVALGAGTLWLSDARPWTWLRWPPAFAADLMALGLIARAIVVPPLEPHGSVIALLLALAAVYVGSVVGRTLAGNQRVQAFDIVQTPCAVGIGLLGALTVARDEPRLASLALGGIGLAGAAGSYAAAFWIFRRRPGGRANVVFFSTLAMMLLLITSGAILSGAPLVAWYGLLAVVAASLGARVSEPQVPLHAAILGLAMAGASGTLGWAADLWFGAGPWLPLTLAHVATVVVGAACLAIPPKASETAVTGVLPPPASVARFTLAAVLVAGIGALTVWWLAPLVAGDPVDRGVLASVTTGVLAVSAVTVAALARISPCVELRWLVYPVLVAGGIKLVADDFRYSTPSTLFAALAVYGIALILAPRILRRS
jgi:hypothetical protein